MSIDNLIKEFNFDDEDVVSAVTEYVNEILSDHSRCIFYKAYIRKLANENDRLGTQSYREKGCNLCEGLITEADCYTYISAEGIPYIGGKKI